jgi:DHA3 family macrolide efflux protein-like MFS transporter
MIQQGPNATTSLRPFFILWTGQAISLLGSQLVQFALIWWLTQETGSATILALATLVGLLPQIILGPFVGVLVDRWNRRLTMLFADVLVAAATLLLAYLFSSGAVQIWHVYFLLFIRALGGSFHWPAMMASTSLMVPEEKLTRIQGLNQTLNGALNIAAAPLGALLLAILPLQGVLAIDVVTAGFAIVPLFFIQIPQPERKTAHSGSAIPTGSYGNDLREGLQYVLARPALIILIGMTMLVNLVLTPVFSLIPLLVMEHFDGTAWHFGTIEAGAGIGILIGGVVLSLWGGFNRRIVTTLLGLVCLGLSIFLLGMIPANLFFLAVALAVIAGFTIPMVDGPLLAILQVIVSPDLQGRVFTLLGSLSKAMAPLSLLIAGPIADLAGIQSWFVVGGLGTLIFGISGFFVPQLLHIEEKAHEESSERETEDLSLQEIVV